MTDEIPTCPILGYTVADAPAIGSVLVTLQYLQATPTAPGGTPEEKTFVLLPGEAKDLVGAIDRAVARLQRRPN